MSLNYFKKKYYFFFIVLFCFSSSLEAQNVIFSGKVTDTLNSALEGANVLLFARDSSTAPSFGITDNQGKFKISVKSDQLYNLTLTFMGFKNINESIGFTQKNALRDYKMQVSAHELEEVVLNYKPPIERKKDTTTYDVSAFSNGKERKLKELLKKLPGIEVNRKGQVFFKNKKVSKVLVEDRQFFDGQTKIAVENIPSEVIDKIQMIEDYQEVSFLKDFVESDELVMNIKLKDGEKNFLFGDLETSIGVKERYRLHPSIFKYSPKLLLNFIGDANNTVAQSFTVSDYLKFEGEKDIYQIGSVLNSTLAKFLQNREYYKNKHLFAGFNGQYNPNKIHEIRLFAIKLADDSHSNISNDIIYQANQTSEKRVNNGFKNNNIFLGKLQYKFIPDDNTVIKMEAQLENTFLTSQNKNSSDVSNIVQVYDNNNVLDNTSVKFNLEGNKWFSDKNTTTFTLGYNFKNELFNQDWRSMNNIFSSSIPVQNDILFRVGNTQSINTNAYDIKVNHFYRPSRVELLTFEFIGNIEQNQLTNNSFQTSINSLKTNLNGFNNQLKNQLNDLNTVITYKRYLGDVIASLGLKYQNVFWKDKVQNLEKYTEHKNLLPTFKLEWNINEKKKLIFSYNQRNDNPNADLRFANRTILDFNNVFEGNSFLRQTTNQRFGISYSYFKTYGWSAYANFSLQRNKNQITNIVTYDGINGLSTPLQLDTPNDRASLMLRLKYSKKYWRLSATNRFFYTENITTLNNLQIQNLNRNINSSFEFRTNLEKMPNVDLSIQNSIFNNINAILTNKTRITTFDFAGDYDYKNWKFRASYLQNYYRNKSQSNSVNFNQIDGSVFYRKEDSLWEFGIDFNNLSNTKVKTSNNYNLIRFSETNTLVFPRTIMFNVFYKL